jgi:hypothetical protein
MKQSAREVQSAEHAAKKRAFLDVDGKLLNMKAMNGAGLRALEVTLSRAQEVTL